MKKNSSTHKDNYYIVEHALYECKKLTLQEIQVIIYVQSFQKNNKICFASNETIASKMKLKTYEVERANTSLVKKGILQPLTRHTTRKLVLNREILTNILNGKTPDLVLDSPPNQSKPTIETSLEDDLKATEDKFPPLSEYQSITGLEAFDDRTVDELKTRVSEHMAKFEIIAENYDFINSEIKDHCIKNFAGLDYELVKLIPKKMKTTSY